MAMGLYFTPAEFTVAGTTKRLGSSKRPGPALRLVAFTTWPWRPTV